MPASTLRASRHTPRLPVPAAFASAHSQLVLADPAGLGRFAPTMARPRERRRVGADALALAVRKDFNAAAISEMEVITGFLYAVKNQSMCVVFHGAMVPAERWC